MHAADVRVSFRDFAGQERYRRFVRTLNRECRRKQRLFFWQEELWRQFVASTPGAPTDEATIMNTFRICDVHGCDLEALPCTDLSPRPDEIRHTAEFDEAHKALFPLAAGGELVCIQCRSERQRWIADNLDLCRILRCVTTYEAYCRRHFEMLTDQTAIAELKKQAEAEIKKRSAEIAAQMQPGDELWEWDGGGWHQLAGRSGLAIVRGGKIIRQWCDFRS
jgi:hypothetical protein